MKLFGRESATARRRREYREQEEAAGKTDEKYVEDISPEDDDIAGKPSHTVAH